MDSTEQLKKIISISHHMSTIRELDPLLSLVINETVELFGAENGYIVLTNTAQGLPQKIRSTVHGEEENLFQDTISQSILSKVLTTSKSLVVTNALANNDFSMAKSVMQLRLRSVMCAPLSHNASMLGAIYLENKKMVSRFDTADLALLEMIANHAAVAVTNAWLNESLTRASERLEKIDSQRKKLIQIIGHELRTPVTNLALYIHLYKQQPLSRYIDTLETITQNIAYTIEDVMILSHLISEQLAIRQRIVSVKAILDSVLRLLTEPMQQRQLTLHVHDATGSAYVQADKDKLSAALTHVLANAIKYTPDGGDIFVLIDFKDDGVVIQVRDTGVGIPAVEKEEIFKLFYTLEHEAHHSSSRFSYLGGGLGIGLALARGVIEAHGGNIHYDSPGRDFDLFPGATCTIWLPRYG